MKLILHTGSCAHSSRSTFQNNLSEDIVRSTVVVSGIDRKLTNLEDADEFVFVEAARGQSQGFHTNFTKGECGKA